MRLRDLFRTNYVPNCAIRQDGNTGKFHVVIHPGSRLERKMYRNQETGRLGFYFSDDDTIYFYTAEKALGAIYDYAFQEHKKALRESKIKTVMVV